MKPTLPHPVNTDGVARGYLVERLVDLRFLSVSKHDFCRASNVCLLHTLFKSQMLLIREGRLNGTH